MAGKYLAPRKSTPGCRPKGGDPIRDKRRKIITIALAVLFFLLALGLTVYPIFSSRYNEAHQSQIYTEDQDAVQALPSRRPGRKPRRTMRNYGAALSGMAAIPRIP